jgi:hypothetical protein
VAGKCPVAAGGTVTVEMHQQNGDRGCKNEAIGGAHYGPVLVYMSKVDDSSKADGSSGWFKGEPQEPLGESNTTLTFGSLRKWLGIIGQTCRGRRQLGCQGHEHMLRQSRCQDTCRSCCWRLLATCGSHRPPHCWIFRRSAILHVLL